MDIAHRAVDDLASGVFALYQRVATRGPIVDFRKPQSPTGVFSLAENGGLG